MIASPSASQVSGVLAAFESGKVDLEEITATTAQCEALVGYYRAHSNSVSRKAALPVSRSFALTRQFEVAAALATEYVEVYSNDWRGWRILGSAQVSLGEFESAVVPYVKAVELGDTNSLAPLAFSALKSDLTNIVRRFVPDLMGARTSDALPETRRLDVVTALALYSCKVHDAELFVKALDGIDLVKVFSREDLQKLVEFGCDEFDSPEVTELCKRLKVRKGASRE